MDELPIQRIKDLIQQDDPAALDIIYDHLEQRHTQADRQESYGQ